MALQRNLPLYADNLLHDDYQPFCQRSFIKQAHTGLLFDKYVDTWGTGFGIQEPNADKPGSKRCFYDEMLAFYKGQQKTLSERLTAHHDRRASLLQASRGKTLTAKTDWRFISGLGVGHPFKAGFIWHRTLSVPYLPGSSVKGMVRAWAGQWGGADEATVTRLFGPAGEEARKCPDTGSLIVFDVLPVQVPKLELDIMNPHYGDYYSEKKDSHGNLIPPADYLSPVPVFFIAVAAKTAFQFALAPRCPQQSGAEKDRDQGLKLLKKALDTLGAGGKTAVGYGRMNDIEIHSPNATPEESAHETIVLWPRDVLAEMLGKRWKKTLEDLRVSEDFVKAAVERRSDIEIIRSWDASDKENQRKFTDVYTSMGNTGDKNVGLG